MIIVGSPLRISLGGGGTDLPSYYKEFGGFLISAAINKYVYSSVLEPYSNGIYLKYSKTEKANSINKIKHPIIKEVLKKFKNNSKKIEITTLQRYLLVQLRIIWKFYYISFKMYVFV